MPSAGTVWTIWPVRVAGHEPQAERVARPTPSAVHGTRPDAVGDRPFPGRVGGAERAARAVASTPRRASASSTARRGPPAVRPTPRVGHRPGRRPGASRRPDRSRLTAPALGEERAPASSVGVHRPGRSTVVGLGAGRDDATVQRLGHRFAERGVDARQVPPEQRVEVPVVGRRVVVAVPPAPVAALGGQQRVQRAAARRSAGGAGPVAVTRPGPRRAVPRPGGRRGGRSRCRSRR